MNIIAKEKNVLLEDICKDTDLPKHFLAKIFQQLVREKLIVSIKGRGGGFTFAKPPSEIFLYQIVEILDGKAPLDGCIVGLEMCNDNMPCPQHENWKPIKNALKDFLQNTSLDMMSQALIIKLETLNQPIPCRSEKKSPLTKKPSRRKKISQKKSPKKSSKQ